ncbi:crossover junction endodeoxyribonuclease RuvC [Candidatus Cardinium hertigii]|uniref:Crossover junction endodeoxyribonuclease RuvC n=1 Tax=Candidatus Cardinium hertigii TaxID=247481 RepID=A0A3N2QAR3_9BACT|nr:crossover junction endodeoxyribonuclease RuvC [Candidatus Cardinium hertigii]ROT46873.1 crossover junction endodeoxyribonuclease RuvC [Candidatus Cardinium hertigii]ROT46876.1 crossover junction endodeoxyribonuclease RuvC [Candidatus Cardinium hertigii]
MGGRIILGIDPGSVRMGFGIIQETHGAGSIQLIKYGVFQLKTYKEQLLRMRYIYTHMMALLQKYGPDEVAIEAIFHGTNVQSMLKLGRAQGVAIAAALVCEIPVTEYAPRKVKQAVTGHGAASKQQVAAMVGHLLNISTKSTLFDASDALAVALCHSQQRLCSPTKSRCWSQFVADHPNCMVSAP